MRLAAFALQELEDGISLDALDLRTLIRRVPCLPSNPQVRLSKEEPGRHISVATCELGVTGHDGVRCHLEDGRRIAIPSMTLASGILLSQSAISMATPFSTGPVPPTKPKMAPIVSLFSLSHGHISSLLVWWSAEIEAVFYATPRQGHLHFGKT